MMIALSPEAQEIDEHFDRLGQKWVQFGTYNANRRGYQEILAGVDTIREQLGRLNPSSAFESLWSSDISHQIDVMEALAHQFHGKPKIIVSELLDMSCGPGTYKLLEDAFTIYDHDEAWALAMEEYEWYKSIVPSNTRDAQILVEQQISGIRDDIINFGVEQGYLPDGFKLEVDLSLPGTYGRAHWNPELKRFFLGHNYFVCRERNGSVCIDPIRAYLAAFHEVLGHASHQIQSEMLPKSLQMSENTSANIPSRVVFEGLALHREEMAFDWLRQHKKRLDVSSEDIDFYERLSTNRQMRVDPRVTLGVLKEREFFEGLNVKEYIEKFTDNARNVLNYSDPTGSGFIGEIYPFKRAVFEICYTAGYRTVGNLIREMNGHNVQRPHVAQSTGLWGWKTYPQAVKYFMENPV